MKSLFKYILLAVTASSAAKAATLTFTNTGAGIVASGFGDSTGNISNGLVWGVIVDTSGNGFATSNYNSGFTLTGGNTTGITLQTLTGGATDDVLFVNATVTSSLSAATDGAAIGSGRVNSISSVTFGGLVTGTQNFAIVWFDRNTLLNGVVTDGTKFGIITSGTNALPPFVLPAANSATIDYSAAFLGADPLKSTTFTFGQAVPEPSTALLGAVAALGLLRRRR
jgi:hypothetical protein